MKACSRHRPWDELSFTRIRKGWRIHARTFTKPVSPSRSFLRTPRGLRRRMPCPSQLFSSVIASKGLLDFR